MTFILKRLCLIASALVVGAGFNAACAASSDYQPN